MDYLKLIDLYLEGELNGVEKELLFKEMANNPELQEYLEQQIQFSQLFYKDMQTITVPAEVTNSVFSALNFNIPNAKYVPSTPLILNFWSALQRFATRFLPYVASSLVGGLIAFALLWWFLPNGNLVQNPIGQTNLVAEQGVPVGTAQEVPQITSGKEQLFTKKDVERILQQTLEKYFANLLQNNYITSNSSQSLTNEEVPSNITIEQSPTVKTNSAIELTMLNKPTFSNKIVEQPTPRVPLFATNTTSVLTSKLRNITLGFRGYALKSDPDVNINLSEKGLLNNAGISIGYNLGQNTNVGFEFGQEKFAQKYSLTLYGETTYYKQNPLVWWYGLYIQQSIGNLFIWEDLKPFARVFLGGSQVGPLARGSVGLKYTPDERVTLYLGWEGSILGYKVQDKIYQTKKSGLTYGVSIKY